MQMKTKITFTIINYNSEGNHILMQETKYMKWVSYSGERLSENVQVSLARAVFNYKESVTKNNNNNKQTNTLIIFSKSDFAIEVF